MTIKRRCSNLLTAIPTKFFFEPKEIKFVEISSPRKHFRVTEDDFWSGFISGFTTLGPEPLEDDEFLRYPRDSFADDQKRYGADMYSSIDAFKNSVQEAKTN